MKIKGSIVCPDHGKFTVTVEDKPSVEMRYKVAGSFLPTAVSGRFTAKCPKCGKRLVVKQA